MISMTFLQLLLFRLSYMIISFFCLSDCMAEEKLSTVKEKEIGPRVV